MGQNIQHTQNIVIQYMEGIITEHAENKDRIKVDNMSAIALQLQ